MVSPVRRFAAASAVAAFALDLSFTLTLLSYGFEVGLAVPSNTIAGREDVGALEKHGRRVMRRELSIGSTGSGPSAPEQDQLASSAELAAFYGLPATGSEDAEAEVEADEASSSAFSGFYQPGSKLEQLLEESSILNEEPNERREPADSDPTWVLPLVDQPEDWVGLASGISQLEREAAVLQSQELSYGLEAYPGEMSLMEQASGGPKYLGCYKDKSNRDLSHFVGTGYNTATCQAACHSYKYFGLQSSGQCFCGNSYGKHGSSTACACSASYIGSWLNCVYKVDKKMFVQEPQYMGCFREGAGRRDLPVRMMPDGKDIHACRAACAAYTWFGKQYKNECWCGNSYGSNGVSTACSCDSTTNQGPGVNCVYRVGINYAIPYCIKKLSPEWTSVEDVRKLGSYPLQCDMDFSLKDWKLVTSEKKQSWEYTCCQHALNFATCETFETESVADDDGSLMTLNSHTLLCQAGWGLSGFQVVAANSKLSLRYTCCLLPSSRAFNVCSKQSTTATDDTSKLDGLLSHAASCGTKEVMTSWSLVDSGSQYYTEYTCCSVADRTPMKKDRTCTFIGDNNLITFDGNFSQQAGLDVVWLVKSSYVQIQALVNKSVQEIAVSGSFLDGHKLLIFQNGSSTWDYMTIDKEKSVPKLAEVAVITRGTNVTTRASLPLNIHLEVTTLVGSHLDGFISMPEIPGGQEGRCGNNNGFADDDEYEAWKVFKREQLLFVQAATQDIIHHVTTCIQFGRNWCDASKWNWNQPEVPVGMVVGPNLPTWGYDATRDYSTMKILRTSNNGAVYAVEEPDTFQTENPAEWSRSYSSIWSNNVIGTWHARSRLDSAQAWSAGSNRVGQWMTIKLAEVKWVEGVMMQCRHGTWHQCVMKAKFDYSEDCSSFQEVDGGATFETGLEPNKPDSKRLVMFGKAIKARCIKIKVQTWVNHISIRAALSTKALGYNFLDNPPESSRSYSSVWANNAIGTGHARSRLGSDLGWAAAQNTVGQWMVINAGATKTIRGIYVQSRKTAAHHQWVKKVKIQASTDCDTYVNVDNGKTFSTGLERMSEVKQLVLFKTPVKAKCIKIVVQAWNQHITLRAALSVVADTAEELRKWRQTAEEIQSLASCPAETRAKAVIACTKMLTAGDELEDFMRICEHEYCFSNYKRVTEEAEEEQKDYLANEDAWGFRQLSLNVEAVTATAARSSCPYTRKLVLIRNKHEQMAAEEAAADEDGLDPTATIADLVWIGGLYKGGKWYWDDGSAICGYTNWNSTAEAKLGTKKPYLCMSRSTGKWHACSSTDKLAPLCEDVKFYESGSPTTFMSSSSHCPSNEQLAMPKSAAEQLKVMEAVAGQTNQVWLGAWYVKDQWQWLDGTKVCYTNWADKQPDLSKAKTSTLLICMDAKTGKWSVCSGFENTLVPVCETRVPGPVCPVSRSNMALDFKLSSPIPMQSHSQYEDYCLYMSKGHEDCHETCARSIGGLCVESGLHVISESSSSCRFAVENFGGIGGTNAKLTTLKHAGRGCTYVDEGATNQIAFANGTKEASCSRKPPDVHWHQICACDAGEQEDMPGRHIMTEGDVVHVTAGGYEEEPIHIQLIKAYTQDCENAVLVDGTETNGRVAKVYSSYWTKSGTLVPGEFYKQVTLPSLSLVKGLMTRGIGTVQTSTFMVKYASVKDKWTTIVQNFTYDSNDKQLTEVAFPAPVTAQYLRIYPLTWTTAPQLKVGASVCGLKASDATTTTSLAQVARAKTMRSRRALLQNLKKEASAAGQAQSEGRTGVVDAAFKLMELQVTPPKGTESGKIGWCKKTACQETALWPLGLKNESWSVDLAADTDVSGNAIWSVRFNGKTIPALNYARSEAKSEMVGLVTAEGAQVPYLTETLIEPDVSHRGVKASMDSDNGCKSHPLRLSADAALTIDFRMRMRKKGLKQCIRCGSEMVSVSEGKATPRGTHIWVNKEGEIVVDIQGNTPRTVVFRRRFSTLTTYLIGISYIAAEKAIFLYDNHTLQDSFIYTKVANSVTLERGFLGCWHGNYKFHGQISAFAVSTSIPSYRSVQDLCGSMRCPYGYAEKLQAVRLPCKGKRCVPEIDKATCCSVAKSCEGFVCPASALLRANPEKHFCSDTACKLTRYLDCCEEKQRCSQLKCKTGYVPVALAHNVSCLNLTCTEKADHETCCRPNMACNMYTCPDGYSPKSDAGNCKSSPCSSADVDVCCSKDGMCTSFTCPAGMARKSNASDIACSDPECKETPFATCCTDSAACSTLSCPDGLVLKEEAKALRCDGLTCSVATDEETCCTKPETCEHMICPSGKTLHGNAKKLHCQGRLCDAKLDAKTCCVAPGKCSSMTCPSTYTHKADAGKTLCLDRFCRDTDFSRCCATEGSCTTLKCKSGYVQRPEAKDLFCKGQKCTADADHERCCTRRALCSQFTCPAPKVPKKTARKLHCLGANCTSADVKTCCTDPGKCTAFTCPSNYAHRHNASQTFCHDRACKDTSTDTCCALHSSCSTHRCPKGYVHRSNSKDLLCRKEKCGDSSKDDDICCEVVSKCSSMTCPAGRALRGNAAQLLCSTSPCSDADDETCCTALGKCSSMTCPFGMKHRADASSIQCSDKACLDTPYSTCCEEDGKCSTYKCPAGYAPNNGTADSHCSSFKCTEADRDLCCDEVPTCGGYGCPAGWALREDAASVKCKTSPCGTADRTTCCVEEGKCTSMTCPQFFLHKSSAATTFCLDKSCNNTEMSRCCEEEGKCSTHKCPDTMVLRSDALELDCKNFKCESGVDDATCCEAKSACNSDACSSTQVLRAHHERHLCSTTTCSQEKDSDECCSNKGMCTLFNCPDGFVQRHNASQIQCEDDSCNSTDFRLCCAEEGTCGTYSCPKNYVRRPSAAKTHCQGLKCGPIDNNDCCSSVQSCGDFSCPAGTALKAHPLKLLCKSATCTDQDTETCCASEGRCDTLTCPEGFNHRHDAGQIFCDAQDCNTTDFHKCCEEDGHCSTMACPTGYVHKKNLTSIKCTNWHCNVDVDRDICCEQNAECAEVICPKPMVLKANKNDLHCADKTCNYTAGCEGFSNSSAQCGAARCVWDNGPSYDPQCLEPDVHTCCAQPGTCSMMSCPEDYLHVHDAHTTPCPDLVCNATNYKSCCVEQNHCKSMTCPTGFAHKSGYEQLFCAGTTCDASDRDICCDPSATCDTHVCPEYFDLREDANTTRCRGLKCQSPDDDPICCVHEANCGFFKCPDGMAPKENAKDILCDDKSCQKTSFTKCCEPKATCDSMKCLPGYVLRPAEFKTACSGLNCTDADHDLCCDPQANCGSYTCPQPYLPKHKAQRYLCRFSECTDLDIHSCCATPDTCGAYRCPLGFALKNNARTIECPAHNCTLQDSKLCCADEGTCGTYHCPRGLVPVESAASTMCTGKNGKCTHDDEATCCQPAAMCSTMACPVGFSLRPLAPHLYCSGATCSEEEDKHTCCAEEGTCATYQCPVSFVHRYDAPKLKCPGNCSDHDSVENTEACCAREGTCDTFKCHNHFLRKPDIGATRCRGAQGPRFPSNAPLPGSNASSGPPSFTELVRILDADPPDTPARAPLCTDADLGTCCDRQEKCSNMTCPGNTVWKADYQSRFCVGLTCVESDASTCCEERAPCTQLVCPSGTFQRPNASCALGKCGEEDKDFCCAQSCTGFQCPAGFVNKTDRSHEFCRGMKCHPMDDVPSCCDRLASCASFPEEMCPAGTVNRGGSALCAGGKCTDADQGRCCGGSCATFTCPAATHVTKADSSGVCDGFNCSLEKDAKNCCSERASCSGFTCQPGTSNRGSLAKCQGSTCESSDFSLCCAQPCYTMACPLGSSYKANYLNLLCNGTQCDPLVDVHSCCDKNLVCEAYSCPAGTFNRGANASCSSPSCSDSDQVHCCQGMCSTNYTCPALYVKRADAENIPCTSLICNDRDDQEKCCEMRAQCLSMECGGGVPPSPDRYCAGSECTATDHETCCLTNSTLSDMPTRAPAPCANTTVSTSDSDYKADSTCRRGLKQHVKCSATFTYKGQNITGCVDEEGKSPWCTATDDDGGWVESSYQSCKECTQVCTDGWLADDLCLHTYTYNGVKMTGGACIQNSTDHSTPWCFISDDGAEWANCTVCAEEQSHTYVSVSLSSGSTSSTTVSSDIVPQSSDADTKEKSTEQLFIVFGVILLAGAFLSLCAVAALSYSRSARSAPSPAAQPLSDDM